MLNLSPMQHAQFGFDYLDELLHTLASSRWCFRDTFGIEKKISEHAMALGIPAPFERPARPEHNTAEELQVWLKTHDPLTDSRYERLIMRLIYAPPPAPPKTLLKTTYWPLGEREQAEFRQFVDRLQREFRRRGQFAPPTDVEAGNANAETQKSGLPAIVKPTHSADFTFVNWFGTEYRFTPGHQAEAVRHLWTEFEKGGLGLSERKVGELIGSDSDDFRLAHTFRRKTKLNGRKRPRVTKHPAWGTMIQKAGPSVYRLVKPESRQNPA